jgi:uncharacterized protein YjbI with pentapeptide repeats
MGMEPSHLPPGAQASQPDLSAIEAQARENHLELIRQEHRLFKVWRNFFHYRNERDAEEREASREALLYWFWPSGRTALVLFTISVGGIATVLLMHKQNELMAMQNYELRRQIYEQAQTDRARQFTDIKDKLYRESDYSITRRRELPEGITEFFRFLPTEEPYFNAKTREEALSQYLILSISPLKKPPKPEPQQLREILFGDWPCRQFDWWCDDLVEDSQAGAEEEDDIQRTAVFLGSAFLSGIDISQYRGQFERIRLNADGGDLHDAILGGAYLVDANLTNGNLHLTHLRGANLTGANLQNSMLAHSNLIEANLSNVDLYGSDLTGAWLDYADLTDAILGKVDLTEADLSHAIYTCEQLTEARNWEQALNRKECGVPIEEPTEQIAPRFAPHGGLEPPPSDFAAQGRKRLTPSIVPSTSAGH